MKKLWLMLGDRFDALQPRERLVVFLALVAVLAGLFYLLAANPALKRYQLARQSVQQSELQLKSLALQEVLLIESSARDPDKEEREQLSAVDRDMAVLRDQLTGPHARLASPEQMSGMLRALIAAQKNLRLVSISSGEVQDLLASADPAAAPLPVRTELSLYRHSVKMELHGDYVAITAYLHQLENLPWQLDAGQVLVKTLAWPQASLSLTLNINSLERAWLAF